MKHFSMSNFVNITKNVTCSESKFGKKVINVMSSLIQSNWNG